MMTMLRFILGDQLSPEISALNNADKANDVVFMAEVAVENEYVPHHRKKQAYILSCMRHFADELTADGYQVDYSKLDDRANTGDLTQELKRAIERHGVTQVIITHPGEYRVLEMMKGWQTELGIDVEIRQDDRFFCSLETFAQWAEGRKELRMEYFYRERRKDTGYLMDDGKPVGGEWNYDSENRAAPKADLAFAGPMKFTPDHITTEVIELILKQYPDRYGDLSHDDFWYAISREQARQALAHFIEHNLPTFGKYQDAMLTDEAFLYHSILSLYINNGLLLPKEVCDAAQAAYDSGHAPLNSVEGFIRQILGWREYVRGLYWYKMPAYKELNFLEAEQPLPDFYWTGKTEMHCLSQALTQTKENAYAHHIQRLMITGNFAMLLGVKPEEICDWYLAVYADAYEWVELPNTLGMSQFADGGIMASKPYASGGNYINKMSNYCKDCQYSIKEKTGEAACPFNYLYWDFLIRNEAKLNKNPRLGMVYRTLSKMSAEKVAEIQQSAQSFKQTLS